MYSCGSLAPKMKAKKEQKQSCGGGCSASITFARDSDYWERVDGAIFIISSLVKSFANQKATLTNIGTAYVRLSRFEKNFSQVTERAGRYTNAEQAVWRASRTTWDGIKTDNTNSKWFGKTAFQRFTWLDSLHEVRFQFRSFIGCIRHCVLCSWIWSFAHKSRSWRMPRSSFKVFR